jgi:hypothetical protein
VILFGRQRRINKLKKMVLKNNNLKYKYKMLIIFFYVMNIFKLNKIEKYKLKESIDIIERNNELF